MINHKGNSLTHIGRNNAHHEVFTSIQRGGGEIYRRFINLPPGRSAILLNHRVHALHFKKGIYTLLRYAQYHAQPLGVSTDTAAPVW